MRRTISLFAGVGALVAMTGIAFASTRPAALVTIGTPVPATTPLTVEQLGEIRSEAASAPERVGDLSAVNQTLGTNGSATFTYPGASYVKVHFSRLLLLPGQSLTVADLAGTESYTYRKNGVDLWGMSVDGDTAVVTLHGVSATVDQVAHGFTATERARQHDADMSARDRAIKAMQTAEGQDARTESVCGGDDSQDAVCYKTADPVAYAKSKAVARLLINGTELCSAWRVGRHNRMLTDNHCFTSTADAKNTEVWFNYECAVCGGFETLAPTKVWADKVLSTNKTLDYTLFTVYDFAHVKPFGYLTIDPAGATNGEKLYIPQHPEGDPTEIAIGSDEDRGGNCIVTDARADGYGPNTDVSYYCDTAGGSSGSPVISRTTNEVIALHHFGGCPNSGVRIELIYDRIHAQL
jgi:lysyl endopeptidase